jgi:starch phosphorylase
MSPKRFDLDVRPQIPADLDRLRDLADNMLFAWNARIEAVFSRLDADLWEHCGHDPQVFLRRVSQKRLDEAAGDRTFVNHYRRAVTTFDSYLEARAMADQPLRPGTDLVAYFCMEYGLHESLRLYSGGLGVLAGDHCKAASDLGLPFVTVGLLFHEGYFDQRIDIAGRQEATYAACDFDDLPVKPLTDADGGEISVHVPLPGRDVELKVWHLAVGTVTLLLLDSDVPANSEADRRITYRLYGGGREMRLEQELCLGVGGVRALRAAGIAPTAWHINEGHSAFQLLERCRELVADGLDFASAWEATAAATTFTTHTPVAAGHDFFERGQIESYLEPFARELGIGMDELVALGHNGHRDEGVNMTSLALRGSRYHNGVSEIHGRVASEMESYVWPEVPAELNPITHVTNGVHMDTFLAPEWAALFDQRFGDAWRDQRTDRDLWSQVNDIPDQIFWGVRQALKARMLAAVAARARRRYESLGMTPAEIRARTRHLHPNAKDSLVVGFARRFTAYKRADLLFDDMERICALLANADRPLLLMYAGKAHPRDDNGQEILRRIHEHANSRRMDGRVVLLEGYDLALARSLVAGVDVWLNTPEYPLEASGTSGMKAGINGVLNLSVLDGWWAEGYTGDNGWAIHPYTRTENPQERREVEARELYDILEHAVLPRYFNRNEHGVPAQWVQHSKASMRELIPRFGAERMVRQYADTSYAPASRRGAELAADDHAGARELAQWKSRVNDSWPRVAIRLVEAGPATMNVGDEATVRVAVDLADLSVDDLRVECVLEPAQGRAGGSTVCVPLSAESTEGEEAIFGVDLKPEDSGPISYRVRVTPWHRLLTHPFETGQMRWL